MARRLLYNQDAWAPLIHPRPMSVAQLQEHIEELSVGGLTTVLLSPNLGQSFAYPGEVGQLLGTHGISQAEIEDMPRSWRDMAANLSALVNAGHDPFALMVQRARERGLEVLGSFRMSDVHRLERPESPFSGQFYRAHPEWSIAGTYAPDLSVPQVREQRVAEIEEMIARYDLDGLEMDFQRTPPFTSRGEAGTEDMTELVGQLHAMLAAHSVRRGRRLLLAARVPMRLSACQHWGLDPAEWHRRGWLEFITIAPYLRIEYDLPITEFKVALPGLPVYASIDYYLHPGRYATPEVYFGAAAALFACGADCIYLFNMFVCRQHRAEEGDGDPWDPPFEVLSCVGCPEGLAHVSKLYLIGRRNQFGTLDPGGTPPLPVELVAGGAHTLRLVVGETEQPQMAVLRVQAAAPLERDAVRVKLNGQDLGEAGPASGARLFPEPHNVDPDPRCCLDFTVAPSLLTYGANDVTLSPAATLTVESVELAAYHAAAVG